jgi:hypothetical protein
MLILAWKEERKWLEENAKWLRMYMLSFNCLTVKAKNLAILPQKDDFD